MSDHWLDHTKASEFMYERWLKFREKFFDDYMAKHRPPKRYKPKDPRNLKRVFYFAKLNRLAGEAYRKGVSV